MGEDKPLKLFGALLIFTASIYIAAQRVKEQRKRIICLSDLLSSFRLMRSELSAAAPEMDGLCRVLKEAGGEYSALFYSVLIKRLDELGDKSFSELWADAADLCLSPLNAVEQRELKKLGSFLGRYELDKQTEALKCCIDKLSDSLELEEKLFGEKRKLSYTLALSAGALLIIILF